MPNIPFTNNYQDLSSQRGFQFKFICGKCGDGYMSTFQPNRLGTAAAAADVAASLFGGIFGRAAQSADQLRAMAAGPQHDSALDAAVREISPLFKQCTRCGNWVCEPVCWNRKAGLCETCAPYLDEEIAAAQAVAARDQPATLISSASGTWPRSRRPCAPSAGPRPRAGSSAPSAARRSPPDASAPPAAPKPTPSCPTRVL